MADKQTPYKPKILLVTKVTFFDIDKLGATTILGKLLADKYGTSVDIYFDSNAPRSELSRIVAPRSINFIENLEANYFTISIERGNARVKEVKWEEKADKIRLLVFTEKGEIDGNKYMVDPGSPHYDIAYSIGIKSEEDLLSQLGEFRGIWDAAETVNLDIRGENSKFAQTNHVYADAKSYAEAVLALAEEAELDIPQQEATELLACLYWKTNSLRNRHTSPDSFSSVENLLKKGASLSKAVRKIYASSSLLEVKARQEMLGSLVVDSDKVAMAKVSPDTARQLAKQVTINPAKNPLSILKDTVASFVLIPVSDNQTLVLLSTPDEQLNARKLFGQYNYVGDRLQAEMSFELGASETEAKIRSILNQKLFSRKQEEKAAATPEPVAPKVVTKPEPAKKPQVDIAPQKAAAASEEKTTTRQDDAELATVEEISAPAVAKTAELAGDPLAPATETITPKPAEDADAAASGNGFGSFGSIGGFGGGMQPGGKDPLPAA